MKRWLWVLGLLTLACWLGPLMLGRGYEDGRLGDAFLGPSLSHLCGTDELGRDILARLLYGGRLSLTVALASSALSAVLGLALGLAAAIPGSPLRAPLLGLFDLLLALPRLPMYLLLLELAGPGVLPLILVLAAFGWASLARLTYALASAEFGKPYVMAARGSGASALRILTRHVLPNVAPALIVAVSLDVHNRIMLEASLSFLGLGIRPPYPSWGGMAASFESYLGIRPELVLPPLAAIFIASYSFQQLGRAFSKAWGSTLPSAPPLRDVD